MRSCIALAIACSFAESTLTWGRRREPNTVLIPLVQIHAHIHCNSSSFLNAQKAIPIVCNSMHRKPQPPPPAAACRPKYRSCVQYQRLKKKPHTISQSRRDPTKLLSPNPFLPISRHRMISTPHSSSSSELPAFFDVGVSGVMFLCRGQPNYCLA
ncbi:unnamed protein product [Chondrus crispus]|uniref:Uncharacterized protein n=1 Tax=Chondrus crispus TaxID=2769 RepID=R7QV74_CHOCR|nr:unnamed protein product [Chondrus crispus]CDF41255.1 unnamed protein product [Chondrus crispus]|eukprot:XP_005711549.1 unnamed protein product [Chondrus crispus]